MSGHPLPRDAWLFLGRLSSSAGWTASCGVPPPGPLPSAQVLCGWAESQGVRPLVEAQLTTLAPSLYPGLDPGALLRATRNREVAALLHFDQRAEEATHALKASFGYPPLVLKGGALRYQVYPAAWLRPCRDLDLLLQPQDLLHAAEVLRGLGYQLEQQRGQPPELATALNLDFGGMRIELHSSLFSRYRSQAGYCAMADSVRTLPGMPSAIAPDSTGHMLVGVLHLVRHGFQLRLKDLADLDRLTLSQDIDWFRLHRQLAAMRLLPALEWTLALLHVVMGSGTPDEAWPTKRSVLGPRQFGALLADPGKAQFWHQGQHLPLPVAQALALWSCADSAGPFVEGLWDVGRRRVRWTLSQLRNRFPFRT